MTDPVDSPSERGEMVSSRATGALRPRRCPCCGCRTLRLRGALEPCAVCAWADAGQDEFDADKVRGGPNGELSLRQARANYRRFGASTAELMGQVRKPRPEEL